MNKCKNCTCENGIKRCISNGVVSEEVLSGWVSVEDRLPPRFEGDEYSDMVLTYKSGYCLAIYSHDKGKWFDVSDMYEIKPKYWMEIPEPPED